VGRPPRRDADTPAAAALDSLVAQFSERSSFVRELVQNSLDAGAGRIDLRVEQVKRRLKIEVIDDGEGMDRATIEGPLLTLFSSSKERDRTRIGKFGVGFVSLFAVAPELVVLDTARDGVHHRVVFDRDRSYTLAEVDEPFEGTAVTLWIRTWGRKAGELATELNRALAYWCRFARAEIWTEGRDGGGGAGEEGGWGWPLQRLQHEFTVGVPLAVHVDEPGLRAVVGFTSEDPPFVGYYNRGLTLLETREAAIPGVSFRVEASALEHTLTRDNVRRDQGYDAVLRRLNVLARGTLRDRTLAELQRLATSSDPADRDRHLALLEIAAAPALDLPRDLPCFRCADGGLASLDDLDHGRRRLGPLRWGRTEILTAGGPGPLVDALSREGRVALLDSVAATGQIAAAARLLQAEVVDVEQAAIAPCIVPTPAVLARAARLLQIDGLAAARFKDAGALLEGRVFVRQEQPGALEQVSADALSSRERGTLVVAVDHPTVRTLLDMPDSLAAPLLAQLLARAMGRGGFASAPVITALLGAVPAP